MPPSLSTSKNVLSFLCAPVAAGCSACCAADEADLFRRSGSLLRPRVKDERKESEQDDENGKAKGAGKRI